MLLTTRTGVRAPGSMMGHPDDPLRDHEEASSRRTSIGRDSRAARVGIHRPTTDSVRRDTQHGTRWPRSWTEAAGRFIRALVDGLQCAEVGRAPFLGVLVVTRSRQLGLLLAASAVIVLMAVGVALASGLPPGGTFTDDDGNIHEGNIEAIAAEGITKGCNPPANTLYCPDGTVTRGQMAAFVRRAFSFPSSNADYFSDDGGRDVGDGEDRFVGGVETVVAAGDEHRRRIVGVGEDRTSSFGST